MQHLADELRKILPQRPSLFPLYGVTLGKTTEIELARVARKNSSSDFYLYNGVNFWVKEGIFASLYLARNIYDIAAPWQKIGFRQQNSYDEWLSVLKAFGYVIHVVRPPHLGRWSDHGSLEAKVLARKDDPCTHLLELVFQYSSGTTRTAPGTLYSISIKASESSDIDKKIAYEMEELKRYGSVYPALGAELP